MNQPIVLDTKHSISQKYYVAEATPSEPFIVSLIRLNLAELQEETESKMGIHTILQKHK